MKRQRGAILIIVFLMLLVIGATGAMLQDHAAYFERAQKENARHDRLALRDAKQALKSYLLLRHGNQLAIATGSARSVDARLLMLPCPDNVGSEEDGDGNLDGTQEGSCRAAPPSSGNVVHGILDDGSRFGRLPWRTANINRVNNALNDGIDVDVRDSAGNRLWYALSRNMAPAIDGANFPLNLHRLVTRSEDWLTVVSHNGVVNNRVAAVLLAPGPALVPRVQEDVLLTMSLNYRRDVASAEDEEDEDGLLSPLRYFEAYTLSVNGRVIANYDRNGVFVQAPPTKGFNDSLVYVDIDELADEDGAFMRQLRSIMGAAEVQNAPLRGRSLAKVRAALQAHRDLFGFYPPPARRDVAAHLSQRERHCSRFHSGTVTLQATLPAGTGLSSAAPVMVSATMQAGVVVDSVLWATVTMAQAAGFLLRQHSVVSLSAATTVLYDDVSQTVAMVTLARYARVTLPAGTSVLVSDGGLRQISSIGLYRLSAAMPVSLLSSLLVTLSAESPLRPIGDLQGWVGEHALLHRRAGNEGWEFALHGDTRAMFWSAARLTVGGVTAILDSGDVLTLAAGAQLRLEEDAERGQALTAAVYFQDGRVVSIDGARATPVTYKRRQFVVWLLSDMVRANATVAAPAVLFPWRERINSAADSRDNLHAYPPCLDSRDFFDTGFETMLQDQPMFYAVDEQCHYGGSPADCGVRGGFTVSVAAGAVVALPQAFTLTHSYTVTVGNVLTLTLDAGVARHSGTITVRRAVWLPVLDARGATLAAFELAAKRALVGGESLVFAARSPFAGGAAAVVERVEALLIYSPGPLSRVACAAGMPVLSGVLTVYAPPLVLANQRAAADDISNLCYWLDDAENADGDGLFVIYGDETRRGVSPRNDYFVLLGGRLRVG